MRLVETLSTAPARLAGLSAGTLAKGAPADLAVIDPDVEWTIDAGQLSSRSTNTPLLGQKVRGRAVMTVVDGEIVYEP